MQWESALEEERRLRMQAESAAAELRVIRVEDMEPAFPPGAATFGAGEDEQCRAGAAIPLETRIGNLEQDNAVLLAKLREAERTLLDAAGMLEQVAGLGEEVERLGVRYLRAREEASRLLHEKLDLRAELEALARAAASQHIRRAIVTPFPNRSRP